MEGKASTTEGIITTIGGAGTSEGNLISGNAGTGLYVSSNDIVMGNYIGTDVTGGKAIGNGGDGVDDYEGFDTIGGIGSSGRNVISGNSVSGIILEGSGGGFD